MPTTRCDELKQSYFLSSGHSLWASGRKASSPLTRTQHFVVVPRLLDIARRLHLHEVHVVHHAAILADNAVGGEHVIDRHGTHLGDHGRCLIGAFAMSIALR